jgi:DNA gyrase subunit B
MNELVSRGHLYIAQPPLYRLKRGKSEIYVKNEDDFADLIIGSGVDSVEVRSSDGVVTDSTNLKNHVLGFGKVTSLLGGFKDEKSDPRVIQTFARYLAVQPETFASKQTLDAAIEEMKSLLDRYVSGDRSYTISESKHEGSKDFVAQFTTRQNGVLRTTEISSRLFSRGDFVKLRKIYKDAESLGKPIFSLFSLEKGEEVGSASTLDELAKLVDERGRKGLSITRYKGLGEMNPEQLWETTMDPTNRVLVQVKIDDAIEADGIFTVLMGDEVEPRRKFIEDNALNIRNLDI